MKFASSVALFLLTAQVGWSSTWQIKSATTPYQKLLLASLERAANKKTVPAKAIPAPQPGVPPSNPGRRNPTATPAVPARIIEYVPSRNLSYIELAKLTRSQGLRPAAAVEIFLIQKVVEKKVREVQAITPLSSPRGQQALFNIAVQSQYAIQQTLNGNSSSSSMVDHGTLNLSGTKTYTGGTMTIDAGSTLMLSGHSVLSDTISFLGNIVVGKGSVFSGSITTSASLTLNSGATIVPSNNGTSLPASVTTGAQIWEGGSTYRLLISDATGTRGISSGWGFIDINGTLTINATSSNPFNIDVTSLALEGNPGAAVNFDPAQNYSWKIVTATGGLTVPFDPSVFNIITSQFSNETGTGSWFITASPDNHDLFLNFGNLDILNQSSGATFSSVSSSQQIQTVEYLNLNFAVGYVLPVPHPQSDYSVP